MDLISLNSANAIHIKNSIWVFFKLMPSRNLDLWPRGLMDKASDFGSEDCGFESHRGRFLPNFIYLGIIILYQSYH